MRTEGGVRHVIAMTDLAEYLEELNAANGDYSKIPPTEVHGTLLAEVKRAGEHAEVWANEVLYGKGDKRVLRDTPSG